jgi:hypothetical protein
MVIAGICKEEGSIKVRFLLFFWEDFRKRCGILFHDIHSPGCDVKHVRILNFHSLNLFLVPSCYRRTDKEKKNTAHFDSVEHTKI